MLVVAFGCIFTLIRINIRVDKFKDIIVLQTTEPISLSPKAAIKDYMYFNRHVKSISIYERKDNVTAKAGNKSETVCVYKADDVIGKFFNFNMLYGTFPKEWELKDDTRVVIDNIVAERLLGKVDCIGEKIKIDNIEYEITGVYKKDNTLLDIMSATEENTVFIIKSFEAIASKSEINTGDGTDTGDRKDESDEISSSDRINTGNGISANDSINAGNVIMTDPSLLLNTPGASINEGVLSKAAKPGGVTVLFKVAGGTSTIIDRIIENDMKTSWGMDDSTKRLDNVDLEARTGIMLVKAIYLVLLIFTAYVAGRFVFGFCSRLKKTLENDYEKMYLWEIIRKNVLKIVAVILLPLAYISLILLALRLINFSIVLPPDIIPSRLIDTAEFATKFKNWSVERNNRIIAITNIGLYARYSRPVILACGLLTTAILAYYTRKLKRVIHL